MLANLLVLFLFVFASLAGSTDPKFENLEKVEALIEQLKGQEGQEALLQTLQAYAAEKRTFLENEVAQASLKDRRAQIDGIYVSVELQNQDKFGLRQNSVVEIDNLINNYLASSCSISIPLVGSICASLISSILEDLLPELILIQSLNAQTDKSTQGTATLDLLVHLLTFPGSITTVNSVLNQILGVGVHPATAVGYFTASANYNLNFVASSVNFNAQAFALVQSYTRIIEFQDKNSNKMYDDGELVKSYDLADIGWSAATYSEQTFGSAKVQQVTSKTKDGYVTFTCDTSTLPVLDSNGQIISPNGTKCTIDINNFPFKGTQSYLAIETNIAVIGGNFAGTANTVVSLNHLEVENAPAGLSGGRFSWVPSVESGASSFSVSATASAGVSNGIFDLASDLLFSGSGSGYKDAKKVIFTFQTGYNPSQLTWDPSVTFGQDPILKSNGNSSSGSSQANTLLFLIVLIFTFFFSF